MKRVLPGKEAHKQSYFEQYDNAVAYHSMADNYAEAKTIADMAGFDDSFEMFATKHNQDATDALRVLWTGHQQGIDDGMTTRATERDDLSLG